MPTLAQWTDAILADPDPAAVALVAADDCDERGLSDEAVYLRELGYGAAGLFLHQKWWQKRFYSGSVSGSGSDSVSVSGSDSGSGSDSDSGSVSGSDSNQEE